MERALKSLPNANTSKMKKKILKECLRMALEKNPTHPEFGRYHHFSFVIQNRKILEFGMNREGTPINGFGYPEFGKIHSETDAYRKAKGLLDSQAPFDMVNIRLSKQGFLRLSKPCSCCHAFLSMVGCRSVFFTTDQKFGKIHP